MIATTYRTASGERDALEMHRATMDRNARTLAGRAEAAKGARWAIAATPCDVDTRAVHGPETREVAQLVDRFRLEVAALAAEHGHELGAWQGRTRGMAASVRCEGCHRSAAVDLDAAPLPSGSLTSTPCPRAQGAPRYYATKSGRLHYVRDRENPAGEPVASYAAKGGAAKAAAALNAPAVVVAATGPGDVVKARAKVERARRALAKAEGELLALEGAAVATPGPVVIVDAAPEHLDVRQWLAAIREAAEPLAAPCGARRRAALARLPRTNAGGRA